MSKKRDSLGLDSLSDSLATVESNKPDFRELDIGSPVSPLRGRLHATATSSSSSSSSGSRPGAAAAAAGTHTPRRSDSGHSTHSGELSSAHAPRSDSSGTSPAPAVLPSGNICPTGRILKPGIASRTSHHRSDVLGSGTGNYGHGSIIRGGGGGTPPPKCDPLAATTNIAAATADVAEELKKSGNEQYKRGNFSEALGFYDRAIAMSPANAAYRGNRAAALTGLGRVWEAVRECEEAVRLDPCYGRAHQRLASLFLRLGQVENSRLHLSSVGAHPDPAELQKLLVLERHLNKCTDCRRVGDWRNVLRESEAAIAAGADHCAQLSMCRAEAFLKLHQFDDAEPCISSSPKLEPPSPLSKHCSRTKFFGMISEAYLYFVRAQYEMSLGRFENAVTAAEKAGQLDARNIEVAVLLHNVRLVSRARARGNDLFKSERFTEACSAYGEGLRLDSSNSVLYCNRAACWFKLGMWEKSIDDCNQALSIQPNYTKALLRRAASNTKLERWEDSVRDYEVLRKELPYDNEVAESLFHAQVALKKSRGEEVSNLKFGGEVEKVSGVEHFRAAISLSGVSIVYFKTNSNPQCKQVSPFVDTLCDRYPSINFLKVDIEENLAVANSENVRIVPTFKIYKNGNRVKEIVCPSREMLEHSVRHYSL